MIDRPEQNPRDLTDASVVSLMPDLHIGARIKAARQTRGLSIEDIGRKLRIQTEYLKAIEELDQTALPSIGYVLGYVRTYASYIGLDGCEAVEAYKTVSQIPKNLVMRDRPHFVPKLHIRLPKGFVPATTMLSCAGVLAFWYASNIDAQSSALTTVNDIQAQTYTETSNIVAPDLMTIKAVSPSWVKIKDSRGKVIISRIFVAGESWQTKIDSDVKVTVRDSGALELYIGENRIGYLGTKGTPAFDIPMSSVQPESALEITDTNSSQIKAVASSDHLAQPATPVPALRLNNKRSETETAEKHITAD